VQMHIDEPRQQGDSPAESTNPVQTGRQTASLPRRGRGPPRPSLDEHPGNATERMAGTGPTPVAPASQETRAPSQFIFPARPLPPRPHHAPGRRGIPGPGFSLFVVFLQPGPTPREGCAPGRVCCSLSTSEALALTDPPARAADADSRLASVPVGGRAPPAAGPIRATCGALALAAGDHDRFQARALSNGLAASRDVISRLRPGPSTGAPAPGPPWAAALSGERNT